MLKSKEIKTTRSRMENQMVNVDDILTEAEAARFLKVSSMTLSRWRNAGVLAFYRPGGYRIMYSKSKHLLPFLESSEILAKAG
jgi:excisionase family DNA binding protein